MQHWKLNLNEAKQFTAFDYICCPYQSSFNLLVKAINLRTRRLGRPLGKWPFLPNFGTFLQNFCGWRAESLNFFAVRMYAEFFWKQTLSKFHIGASSMSTLTEPSCESTIHIRSWRRRHPVIPSFYPSWKRSSGIYSSWEPPKNRWCTAGLGVGVMGGLAPLWTI